MLDLKFEVKVQFFQRQHFGNGCSLKKLTGKIIPLHFYLSLFSGFGVFHLLHARTHTQRQANKQKKRPNELNSLILYSCLYLCLQINESSMESQMQ